MLMLMINPSVLHFSLSRSPARSFARVPPTSWEKERSLLRLPRDKSSLALRGEWTKEGLALEKRHMDGELVLVWRRRVTNHLLCGRVAWRVCVCVVCVCVLGTGEQEGGPPYAVGPQHGYAGARAPPGQYGQRPPQQYPGSGAGGAPQPRTSLFLHNYSFRFAGNAKQS